MSPPDDEEFDYGRLVVLQHADHTGVSHLQPTLDGRAPKRPWTLVRPDRGEPLPADRSDVRGVLLLGGPQSVTQRDELPWLDAEIAWVADTVEAGVPVFGICLGHQILAAALGGRVERRERPEIGFLPLRRTEDAADDEVFAGWPDGAEQLVIHDDDVTARPDGAVVVATGTEGVTAFRAADELSYGVQFHPETSAALFEEWAGRDDNRPRFEAAGVDPRAMVDEAHDRDRFLRANGVSLVGRWLDGVVGRDDPMPRRRPKKASR